MKKIVSCMIAIILCFFVSQSAVEENIYKFYTFYRYNKIDSKENIASVSEHTLADFIIDNVREINMYRLFQKDTSSNRYTYSQGKNTVFIYTLPKHVLILNCTENKIEVSAIMEKCNGDVENIAKYYANAISDNPIKILEEDINKYSDIKYTALDKARELYSIC